MYIWFNGLILLTTVFPFEPCSQTAVFVEALMVSGVGSRVSRHFVSGVQATQTCPAVAVVFLFEESYLCNGMSFQPPQLTSRVKVTYFPGNLRWLKLLPPIFLAALAR